MDGTVLVRWEQGYEEAICVVSDLSPEKARTAWYQMRFWIEDEYKDGKRGWFRLRTDQDDQPATGEPTVVGVRYRPAKSDCAGRTVRSRGAASQTEEQEAPVGSQTTPRTASLAPGASAGTGTERVIARDHGPAGSRVGRQEALAQRSGESRATALPLACGETGVQKSPDEEKTPRGKEAEQTTRPGQGQTGAASAGAGGQTSHHLGTQAGETRAAGGQTSRHPGQPREEKSPPFTSPPERTLLTTTRSSSRLQRTPGEPDEPGPNPESRGEAKRNSPSAAFARWSSPAPWQARASAIRTPQRFLEPTPTLDCGMSSKSGSSSSALPRASPAATQARAQGNSPKAGSWTSLWSGSMKKPTREKFLRL